MKFNLRMPTLIGVIIVGFIGITASILTFMVSSTLYDDAEHNAGLREAAAIRAAATLIERTVAKSRVEWDGQGKQGLPANAGYRAIHSPERKDIARPASHGWQITNMSFHLATNDL